MAEPRRASDPTPAPSPGAAPPPIDSALDTAQPEATRASRMDPAPPALPRGVVIVVGLAGVVVTIAGIKAVADIVGPIFLALVLTITVYPVRRWLQRHGAPGWLATLLVVLAVYAIIIGLAVSFVYGVARLASLLPDYAEQMQTVLANLQTWFASAGIEPGQFSDITGRISPSSVIGVVGAVLSSAFSVVSALFFVITLVLFMGLDSAFFTVRATRVPGIRAQAMNGLNTFALGTRRYFAVSTVFGGVVAVLDFLALLILGVPAAFLWGILAFVTNYVPNVGFIIGVIPPALLALLSGGPGDMVAVIVIYCVLNFVIQSVLQPKFVGDAVGLTTTVSFLSLIAWSFVLGPLGAILAVPATLLVKAVLVDVDPDARWLQLFLGDAPVLDPHPRRRRHPAPPAAGATNPAGQPVSPAAGDPGAEPG